MEKFLKNLQGQAEDNPFVAIGIGVAVLTTLSKIIDTYGNAKGRRTWTREVKRRERKFHKK
jgi:hypothetical protein